MLKIVNWNCNGALRKKLDYILSFDADIYIIQECENPNLTNDAIYKQFAKNHLWIGNNKNKGLGVFAKENVLIENLNWSSVYEGHKVNYFLPFLVNKKLNIVGVWAHQNNSPTFGYIGQVWKYLQINKDNLTDTSFIGDFNSNSIWDVWDKWWNHSDVVAILEQHNCISFYHHLYNCKQGEELDNTFYLQKNVDKGYHIDYVFLPKKLINDVNYFIIDSFENAKAYSDHCPMIIILQ